MDRFKMLTLLALRSMVSHRVKNAIVSIIMIFGTMLVVVGTSILDSVELSMQQSITASATGHVQVYSSEAEDDLAIFGGMGGATMDIGEIEDFERVVGELRGIDGVKAVVPMGLGNAVSFGRSELDRVLDGVHASVRTGRGITLDHQKQLRQIAALMRDENRNRAAISTDLDRLDEELVRLEHAERLGGAAAQAAEAFYEADPSITQHIGRHEDALARAAQLDPTLEPLVAELTSVRDQLEAVAIELGDYARQLDADPARLEEARSRRRALLSLCRKHACDLDGVVAKRLKIGEQLERMDDAERQLERLTEQAESTLASAGAAARTLSAARQATASALSEAITTELHDLGMGSARVEVSLERLSSSEGGTLRFEGARLGERGLDAVELLIAPNPGEPPRPLAKVASGGELSRALLAIKRVLAHVGPVGLYVFDEVDTGVGGAVAESIAQKMAEVARHHQVLCITHQAPIAAYGHAHHVVSKRVEGERTYSEVRPLGDAASRVDELARMLAGITVTEAARQTARELLEAARA